MKTDSTWDVEYGVFGKGGVCSTARLVVDYNYIRLRGVTCTPTRCCELSDLILDSPARAIRIHVLPFTPNAQIARDLAAAGHLLAVDGLVEVVIHEAKAVRAIGRIAMDWYREVDSHKGRPPRLVCRTPKVGELPDVFTIFDFVDPKSGRTVRFQSRKGLFSHNRVDPGTLLLLETLPDMSGQNVLDVGCGYGAIGVILADRGANVTMIDIDARAVSLASHNLETNKLAGNVFLRDGADIIAERSFDAIVANPPTHVGSETLRCMARAILKELTPEGCCYLVFREHLNYEKLLLEYAHVSRAAIDRGYKIIRMNKR